MNTPQMAENKSLTPQQVALRRKMMVYPLLFIIFAAAMWLIFGASGSDEQPQAAGLNTSLPTPEQSGIVEDKREAYLQQEMEQKERAKRQSLQDFAFDLDEQVRVDEPEFSSLRNYSHTSRRDNTTALSTSTSAYEDVNRQLQSFYEEPTQEPQDELQARIEELEMQLAEAQEQKSTQEEQLELLERSYEIAARYMQDKEHPQSQPDKEPTVSTNSRKITVRPMPRATRAVVSHLAAPISDSTLMAEFSQPRNSSFNTLADDKELSPRTAIRAAVYRTTTISDGDDVALRLLEDVIAGASIIPANSIVVGMARITQGRVQLSVSSIHHNGAIIPVELSAYDLDGVEGIAARGTEELSAIKEIAADMGSGMGSSITITDDAGTQLLSDMGRSVIQGTSQYISQKMRTVRITLKSDYMVLLQPPID